MDSQAIREEKSDNHDLEAWVNPITKERHYFVSFPVVNGRMPRSILAELQRSDVVCTDTVEWHPESPLPNVYVTITKKGDEPDTFPKFNGQVGSLGAHLRWLLAWLIWTLVEVQFKWGRHE